MTRGLTREQIGVTEAMLQTYGDAVFELSHNFQVRRGDPVRELNWDEIERQREGTGLSDPEIARKFGLTRDQVTYIRVLTERRRFKRQSYHRLYDLGGGRRFRTERFTAHEDRFTFTRDALALREALAFPPDASRNYLRSGQWADDTVTDWLTRRAADAPDAVLIRQPTHSITYEEALERACRLANAFAELGLRRGDVIAIQLPNTADFVIFYLAATMMGAVVSTMHMPYRIQEMEPLLRHGRARAVLCGPAAEGYDAPATMLALRDRLDSLEYVIVAGGTAPAPALGLDRLIADSPASPPQDQAVAADPAILCFTSGTSSAPKAVVHNCHTMLSNNRIAAPIYNLSANDVILGLPPFTHAFGLCILNLTLMAGASCLLMPAFSPSALSAVMDAGKPSVLFAAPAHIAACMKSGHLTRDCFSSLRLATISGSACPPELARSLQEVMPAGSVGQMWGMSECFMGLHTPFEAPESLRYESLGSPTSGFEVRISHTDAEPADDGEEGELQIRGCSVVAGYFGNDKATREAFTEDGWFRTGDLAVRHADHDIRITGRLKDIINRGGIKINPVDIEAALDKHPAVAVSAIAPVPDEVLGERACAYLQLLPDQTLTLEEVCTWLRNQGIARMKWPEALEVVEAMPMTPTRKIIKSRLGRH